MPEPTNSGASTVSSGLLGALHAAESACRRCNAALERFTATLVSPTIEITVLTKKGGPLTKQICLTEEGKLRSDGSACVMSRGVAQRACFDTLSDFAEYISTLGSNKAIALGALKSELPDAVEVVTKNRLKKRSLQTRSAVISRTREYLDYREAAPALALIDFDSKGMPQRVQDRIEELGGPLPAVKVVLPGLAGSWHVIRRSASACIRRTDTDKPVGGSDGLHIYVLVEDGADVERFLPTLHERFWLNGLGWLTVGAGGQILERSLVDRTVYAPERLVFEGAPILVEPLIQNLKRRRAKAIEGPPFNTLTACPPLRIAETAKLDELRAVEAHQLAPERAKARTKFIESRAERIAERTGGTIEAARRTVERQIQGVLTSNVVLPFDDPELRGCTVDDVLNDPPRFEDATLADPLEGVKYGRCKAKIMRRADGSMWIHSFAHGRTTYELKFDAKTIDMILANTPDADVMGVFIRLALDGDIASHEFGRLRDALSARLRINKRTIDQAIKAAAAEKEAQRAQEERERRLVERRDPRPQILVPAGDAPWLPVVEILNDILGKSTAAEPPARDSDGYVVQIRVRRPPKMHLLTAEGANAEATDQIRLPPPEQPLLTRLDETSVAELIEQHIDFADIKGRSVHLQSPFVRHFVRQADDALPLVSAIATLPIVLRSGKLLSGNGLDRDRGIVFRIPKKLFSLIPTVADCTRSAVMKAMRFLVNEWLCDVATDYCGKCCLIAIAATIIERILLPERPAFFISAGQRGGGKTTTLNMIAMAALGTRAAAAAWSPNEEERAQGPIGLPQRGPAVDRLGQYSSGLDDFMPVDRKGIDQRKQYLAAW